MKIIFLYVVILVLSVSNIFSQSQFNSIDKHTIETPKLAEKSLIKLVSYLTKPAKSDLEKVRSFYVWIANNISYDTRAFFNNSHRIYTPDEVLKRRRAVCQGYSKLFKKMCDIADIKCYVISGYSKGYGYSEKTKFRKSSHAWNVVKINNKWHLVDVTWGSGYIDDSKHFKRQFEENYFFTNPNTFIYKHLPTDPMWQLLETPITIEEFRADSTQIKVIIESKKSYFNFNDSIQSYENLPKFEKQIKSALNAYNYNKYLSEPMGYAYMNYAYDRFKTLNNSELSPQKALAEQQAILKLYEKAYSYFKLSKEKTSFEAIKICRNNIKMCKGNINTYKKIIESNGKITISR